MNTASDPPAPSLVSRVSHYNRCMCVRVCVYARARVCVCMCVCVFARARARACACVYLVSLISRVSLVSTLVLFSLASSSAVCLKPFPTSSLLAPLPPCRKSSTEEGEAAGFGDEGASEEKGTIPLVDPPAAVWACMRHVSAWTLACKSV